MFFPFFPFSFFFPTNKEKGRLPNQKWDQPGREVRTPKQQGEEGVGPKERGSGRPSNQQGRGNDPPKKGRGRFFKEKGGESLQARREGRPPKPRRGRERPPDQQEGQPRKGGMETKKERKRNKKREEKKRRNINLSKILNFFNFVSPSLILLVGRVPKKNKREKQLNECCDSIPWMTVLLKRLEPMPMSRH